MGEEGQSTPGSGRGTRHTSPVGLGASPLPATPEAVSARHGYLRDDGGRRGFKKEVGRGEGRRGDRAEPQIRSGEAVTP